VFSRLATLLLAIGVLALAAFAVESRSSSDAGAADIAGGVAFVYGDLPVAIDMPTSLAFGPDGRLYVTSRSAVYALTLSAGGRGVLDVETIASGLEWVIGIAFDPTAPASPFTLYVSRQDPSATDGFEGTISRFTAPDWQREDVITGLPTSAPMYNHLTNGIAFDADGRLYIAQGSGSDGGIGGPAGGAFYWPETPLSAAILTADLHAPAFDGHITYDPPGPPESESVDLVSGDVSVVAPGLRNPYDLVLHSNGLIYATDNGAMGQATSLSCTETGGTTSTSDELNLIEEGNYYGFPNRNRGRFDPRQCTYHTPEEGDGADFTGPIAILPRHCSCDGIAEYTSDVFAGEMRGDLVYAEFSFGRVSRARLSDDGRSVLSTSPLSAAFSQPLDVAVAADGTIYVADFAAGLISYLAPDAGASTPAPTPTASPATPTPPGATPTPLAATPTASAATPTPSAATPPGAGLGDVNCDGMINSIDAALVLQLSSGLTASLPCSGNADVNVSGAVNAIDAALILQRVAGLIDHLPP